MTLLIADYDAAEADAASCNADLAGHWRIGVVDNLILMLA
jgi:hypothetical protein